MSAAYLDTVSLPMRELQCCMLRGERPDPNELAGEYCGTNMPATSRALGIRRFIKGFLVTDEAVTGYNRRVRGASLTSAWNPSTWRGRDRFGFFTVAPVDPRGRDNRYLNALLLDYGAGENPRGDVTRVLRDYLVRMPNGVLLGQAFLAIGAIRVPVGFFALEPAATLASTK